MYLLSVLLNVNKWTCLGLFAYCIYLWKCIESRHYLEFVPIILFAPPIDDVLVLDAKTIQNLV